MVKIAFQIKANLENLTNLKPEGKDFRWYIKVKCQSCGEVSPDFLYLTEDEESELKGNRSYANLVAKCKLCKRENSINILPETIHAYTSDHSESFHTIACFDCRGFIPVEFEFLGGWCAEGVETGTKFEVDLKEKEWADYDEKGRCSVGVYELEHRFEKVH